MARYSETRKWQKPIMKDGQLFDFEEVEVTIEFDWVDNGIGAYEYWGAKGNHTQWQAEIASVKDAEGNEIYDQIEEDQIIEWENSVESEPEDDEPIDLDD
jgi:hypothetical protein